MIQRFKDDLIKHLMASLHETDPDRLARILRRHQFRHGDVTFRRTATGRTFTELNRWPWQTRQPK